MVVGSHQWCHRQPCRRSVRRRFARLRFLKTRSKRGWGHAQQPQENRKAGKRRSLNPSGLASRRSPADQELEVDTEDAVDAGLDARTLEKLDG